MLNHSKFAYSHLLTKVSGLQIFPPLLTKPSQSQFYAKINCRLLKTACVTQNTCLHVPSPNNRYHKCSTSLSYDLPADSIKRRQHKDLQFSASISFIHVSLSLMIRTEDSPSLGASPLLRKSRSFLINS